MAETSTASADPRTNLCEQLRSIRTDLDSTITDLTERLLRIQRDLDAINLRHFRNDESVRARVKLLRAEAASLVARLTLPIT